MSDVLARGVVEIGLDDVKLLEQIPRSMRTIKDSMAPLKNTMKETFSEQLARANIAAMKLKDSFSGMDRTVKSIAGSLRDATNSMKLSLATQQQLYGKMQGGYNYAKESGLFGKIGAGAGAVGAGVAVGAGMTFAAAAAAGSTTLNTLTGSIKLLALAAGEKTQSAVLKLAQVIQKMANITESMPGNVVTGGTGLLAGAGVGYRIAGGPGAVVGGLAGMGIGNAIGGGSKMTSYGWTGIGTGIGLARLFGGGLNAARLVGGFGGVAGLGAAAIHEGIDTYNFIQDSRAGLGVKAHALGANKSLAAAARLNQEAAKIEGALSNKGFFERLTSGDPLFGNRTADSIRIRNAAQEIRDAIGKAPAEAKKNDFLTAGLGVPASYAGLADVRQQAQLAGFGNGPLETATMLKEMNNNLNAIKQNTDPNNKGQTVQPPG